MTRKKSITTTPVAANKSTQAASKSNATTISDTPIRETTQKQAEPSIADLVSEIKSQQDEIVRLSQFVDAQAKHIVTIEENHNALKARMTETESLSVTLIHFLLLKILS